MLALRAGYSWPNLNCPRPAGGGPGGRRPPGTLRPMGRCWVRPAGMLTPALTELAGFVASSKIERPPTRLTSPPPHLRWRPTSPRQVGGGDLRPRRTSQRQVGGGDLRRPETSTVGRYVGNVHCRGPTFPFERAFTTGGQASGGLGTWGASDCDGPISGQRADFEPSPRGLQDAPGVTGLLRRLGGSVATTLSRDAGHEGGSSGPLAISF